MRKTNWYLTDRMCYGNLRLFPVALPLDNSRRLSITSDT